MVDDVRSARSMDPSPRRRDAGEARARDFLFRVVMDVQSVVKVVPQLIPVPSAVCCLL